MEGERKAEPFSETRKLPQEFGPHGVERVGGNPRCNPPSFPEESGDPGHRLLHGRQGDPSILGMEPDPFREDPSAQREDCVCGEIGPGDFSVLSGIPGRLEAPEVVRAMERVAGDARAAGKGFGSVAFTPEQVRRLLDLGATLVNFPTRRPPARMDSTAVDPSPLTAPRPNRIADPTAVNDHALSLTSGGSTAIPISRHSWKYLATLSFEDISEVSIAVMNATG